MDNPRNARSRLARMIPDYPTDRSRQRIRARDHHSVPVLRDPGRPERAAEGPRSRGRRAARRKDPQVCPDAEHVRSTDVTTLASPRARLRLRGPRLCAPPAWQAGRVSGLHQERRVACDEEGQGRREDRGLHGLHQRCGRGGRRTDHDDVLQQGHRPLAPRAMVATDNAPLGLAAEYCRRRRSK